VVIVEHTPEVLKHRILHAIRQAGGWLPFDRFMAIALYEPGLGYYANASRKFGRMPQSGSDFVTAPELSPLFGRALAAQVAEALRHTATCEVWEFGAGSGALAEQLLQALGDAVQRYDIVDLSGSLRQRQAQRLPYGAFFAVSGVKGNRVHSDAGFHSRLVNAFICRGLGSCAVSKRKRSAAT